MSHVELVAITQSLLGGFPEVEELLEFAGRICYRSKMRGDPQFVSRRVEEGHESIIEHASASYHVSGISRACSHQLVRHRIASYSQESQRYVDMATFDAVCPESIAGSQDAHDEWSKAILYLRNAYQALRTLGIQKEDARFLLPNAAATQLVMTANFRELLHVFRLRISPAAQWEIRHVAVRMLELVYPHAPHVFGSLWEELTRAHPGYFSNG